MNNLLSNLYTGDKVNTDRQREIDFAKAVIIFCLAFVHITIECCTDEQLCTGVPYLFDSVIGGPFGASVFMLSMGAGIIYTTKNSAHDLFKRGIAIAIAGYLLNFLRFLLPFFIGYQISGDYNQ